VNAEGYKITVYLRTGLVTFEGDFVYEWFRMVFRRVMEAYDRATNSSTEAYYADQIIMDTRAEIQKRGKIIDNNQQWVMYLLYILDSSLFFRFILRVIIIPYMGLKRMKVGCPSCYYHWVLWVHTQDSLNASHVFSPVRHGCSISAYSLHLISLTWVMSRVWIICRPVKFCCAGVVP